MPCYKLSKKDDKNNFYIKRYLSMETNHNFIVLLDDIRSVLNVGAILRTCDGVGVKKIILCGITPQSNHKKLTKTALGAENYVEIEYYKNSEEAVQKLKKEGYVMYSVEQTKNSVGYNMIKYSSKSCFVFGNEITGVDIKLIEESDYCIEIPMYGKKNSLNVSTCVGIILYNAISNL